MKFPIWGSLVLAGLSVLLSIFAILWSVVFTAYAVSLSFGLSFLVGIIRSTRYLALGNLPGAGFIIGLALICAGAGIIGWSLSSWLAKGSAGITKNVVLFLKSMFVGRENTDHKK